MHKYGNFFLANQNEYVLRLLKTAPFRNAAFLTFHLNFRTGFVLPCPALLYPPAPPFKFTFDARGEDIPAMRCECDCDCQCHAMNALITRLMLMLTVSMCRVMGRNQHAKGLSHSHCLSM